MADLRYWVVWGMIVLGLGGGVRRAGGEGAANDSPARYALESIFCPAQAPAQRTMGLLQRSFLDLVEASQPELQVALVVDGTESMAADISGVRSALRNMLEDLRRYRGDHVSCALVIYRDAGAPSGELTMAVPRFTNDAATLEQAFAAIQPETGAPYFPEVPDLGIHQALQELPWSDDPQTSRWVMLFGDAPPYDPDFQEAETGARRRYDTDVLVNLARRKNVQMSCVLCTSREAEKSAYDQVLDKTRRFMNALASGTGGLMLDLSYPDIRQALAGAAKKGRVEYQPIGRITREDIEAARGAAESGRLAVAPSQRIRLAILPHLPLEQMTFDPDQGAVQIAAELRLKLRSLPRAEVKSPVDVDRALRRLRSMNVPQEEWLQALAAQLRVDYLVWGTYRRGQGLVQVKSAIYSKDDGRKLAEADVLTGATIAESQLAGDLTTKLVAAAGESRASPELVAAAAAMQQNVALNARLLNPVSNVTGARSDLLAGFESLEQALAFASGSAEGNALLEQAQKRLEAAAAQDPRNPLAHLWLASCYFNQAQALVRAGRRDEAGPKIQQYGEALKRAYRERDTLRDAPLKTEIEADYSLLIKKEPAEAIQLYQSLAEAKSHAELHVALRAHWMLYGIYCGDWGVGPSIVDAAKAREHMIQILAQWGDSSEAALIRQHIRWDEEKGQNQFQHAPRENAPSLAGLR